MGDWLDLWFLIIPGVLVVFVIGVILNTIFNIKTPIDGRPIYRAPAGSSDSADSSFNSPADLSTYPGHDSGSNTSYSDSSGGDAGSSADSGSSGGGDGGGGGGGD